MILRVLRLLRRVFVQAAVGADLLVLLAEADVLEMQKCKSGILSSAVQRFSDRPKGENTNIELLDD